MQIRLILLDFDGTLADTRRANTLAYVATLREAGYALTEEEYAAKYFGMRCNEFLTRYGIADPAERERLRLRKIALYPAFFDTVRLNRPLWEFCRQFRAQGGRVWIVSTGSRANIDNAMRHLGITVAGQRAGSTGAATSGAAGRFEPDFGVFEDQRFLRRAALAAHGLQKAVRGGFAVLDVGAREYAVHGAVRPFARLGGDCCVCWRTCI